MAVPPLKRALALLCVALISVVAVGCGGDDSSAPDRSDDIQAINQVAVRLGVLLQSADAEKVCALFEPGWVDETFDSRAACAKKYRPSLKEVKDSGQVGGLELENVEFVDDAHAKATFKDGLGSAEFEMVGGNWWLVAPKVSSSAANGAKP